MLKSVLKCMESIRIKKWVKKNSTFECQLSGRGGGLAELVKSHFFFFFLTLPLFQLFHHFLASVWLCGNVIEWSL